MQPGLAIVRALRRARMIVDLARQHRSEPVDVVATRLVGEIREMLVDERARRFGYVAARRVVDRLRAAIDDDRVP